MKLYRYPFEKNNNSVITLVIQSDYINPILYNELKDNIRLIPLIYTGEDYLSLKIPSDYNNDQDLYIEINRIISSVLKYEKENFIKSHDNAEFIINVNNDAIIQKNENKSNEFIEENISDILKNIISSTKTPIEKKWFDYAIKKDPNDSRAWYAKGVSLMDQGEFREAEECFKMALKIDPNYTEARYNKEHLPDILWIE